MRTGMTVFLALSVSANALPHAEKSVDKPFHAPDLKAPVPIHAGGGPINVDVGHAAPFVADLGGKRCLLVGQYGDGKLRIYAAPGGKGEPRLDKFEWFKAGDDLGRVPFG